MGRASTEAFGRNDSARGVRRRGLALLAASAVLAAMIASPAQAQDDQAQDDRAIDVAPAITAAGSDPDNPHTAILVRWEWSAPLSEDWSIPYIQGDIEDDEKPYLFEVEYRDTVDADWTRVARPEFTQTDRIEQVQGDDPGTLYLTGSFRHRNLLAEDSFQYRVRVTLSTPLTADQGPWATTELVSTDPLPPPPPPTEFTAVPSPDDPQSAILLRWDGVPKDSEGLEEHDVLIYRLERFGHLHGEDEWKLEGFVAGPYYYHRDLDPDYLWAYRIQTVLHRPEVGESFSEWAEITVTPNTPPPITGLAANTDTDTPWKTISFGWDRSPQEAGSVVYYQVQYRQPGASDDWTDPDGYLPSSNRHWHDDLLPGSTWEYRVRAVRHGFDYANERASEWSTLVATTDGLAGHLPAPPEEVIAELAQSDDGAITISWPAVIDVHGTGLSYTIQKRSVDSDHVDSGQWEPLASGLTETSHTHTGLAPGSNWQYRVRTARNVDPELLVSVWTESHRTLSVPNAAAEDGETESQVTESQPTGVIGGL